MAATSTKNAAAAPSGAAGPVVIVNGSGNVIQIGNNNNYNASGPLEMALNEIAEQRKMTEKALAQIDHLLGLLARLATRQDKRDLLDTYGANNQNPQRH